MEDRRTFIKILAAGLAVPRSVLGANDRVQMGVIGTGTRGNQVYQSFMRNKDVVFVTGDIHTFIAGDVRTNLGDGDTVAVEFVGGSVTSQGLGETNIDAGGITIPGNDAKPATPPAIIDALRGINSWVDNADFDHHGYGRITARKDGMTSELVRLDTIKQKSLKTLPAKGFKYEVARGQTSIKGKSS